MISREPLFPRIRQASDHSFMVLFGEGISRLHHRNVVRLFRLLQLHPNRATLNIHPAYSSVLVSFDPLRTHPKDFSAYVHKLVGQLDTVEVSAPRVIEVPVCYDHSLGPDLEFVAHHNGLTAEDVVQYHCSVDYLVYFIGFSPGFPYLGELPEILASPRLATPRVRVPAGSVAIGGSQTGIYSVSSPGGWRIIGRTPMRLFDLNLDPPSTLEMGDLVRFRPITLPEYQDITSGDA
jgi:KipI family sensor histidine kinase inhibitor